MKNLFLSFAVTFAFSTVVLANEAQPFQCGAYIKRIVLNPDSLKKGKKPRADYVIEYATPVTTTSMMSGRFSQGVIEFKDGYKISFTVRSENGAPMISGHFRQEYPNGHVEVLSIGGSRDPNIAPDASRPTVMFSSTKVVTVFINAKSDPLEVVEKGLLPSGTATDAWLSCK